MKPDEIERRFQAGECIVEQGTPAATLYIVRSGSVLVSGAHGTAPQLLGEGEMFGDSAAILGAPYAFRAVADDEASVLEIDIPLLNRLCRENGEFAFRLIRHLAERAAGLNPSGDAPLAARIEAARRPLARAILDSRVGGETPTAVRGKLRDLAAEAGIPVRDAYLCLQELLEQRVLGLLDDQLTVLEPDQLEALA